MRPYEIIDELNPLTYKSVFLVEPKHVHSVFCILQFRKHVPNSNQATVEESFQVAKNLSYEVYCVQKLDYQDKRLRNESITVDKGLWANHTSFEAIRKGERL